MLHRKISLLAVICALIPPALAAQGAFGSAVAVSGREVYVGQPDNSYGPGVVYVFRADASGAWRVAKKITQTAAANSDGFGSAIAIDGNIMLVGQAKADSNSGVVVVFTRDASGAWRESGSLKAPERRAGEAFGSGIVLSGGRAYISTGISGFGSMVFSSRGGAVFVFKNTGGTWSAETTLTSSDTSNSQTFGNAVTASGSRLMVGNFRADSGNGAVYVFNRDAASGWKMEAKIAPPGPVTGRNSGFGSSLILRGDTALIGAINDRGAGAVWVFARDSANGRWNPVTRTLPFDGSFGTRYGIALAEVGNELWIGADGASGFEGRVFRVTRDSTGFPTATKIAPPAGTQGGRVQFGANGESGLTSRKPGRKSKLSAHDRALLAVTKQNEALQRKLRIANALIALQKKAHELLGLTLPEPEEES